MPSTHAPGPRLAPPNLIAAEVTRNALSSIAERMKVTLRRASFSPIIYEGFDFACALYDAEVRLLAQANTLPLFLGTMDFAIRSTLAAVGGAESLRAGDVLFNSSGYDIGSHSQDAALIVPAFSGGKLIGYAATKAHLTDMGAASLWTGDTTDNLQEGTIFPGVHLFREGKRQSDIYRTILANSRTPIEIEGDLNAQMSSARIGASALTGLVERFGGERFALQSSFLFDHAEQAIRRRISELPDGRYSATTWIDGAANETPQAIAISVEIRGDSLVVDARNVPDVRPDSLNCPKAATISAARFAVVSACAGETAINEGHFRALSVLTAEGSMFDPAPPAPIFMYYASAAALIDAVHLALANVDPGIVPAGSGGDICGIALWGLSEDGTIWSAGFDHLAGQGASAAGGGGAPLMHISCAGGRSSSAEVAESKFPIVVEAVELAQDSGGVGEHAGGPGVSTYYRLLRDASVTAFVERTKMPPAPLYGGGPAVQNRLTITEGQVSRTISKPSARPLAAGTVIHLTTGGGGGYGRAQDRGRPEVLADVLDGILSEARARTEYPHAF